MKIQFRNNSNGIVPFRAHDNDCGADVFSPISIRIEPHQTVKIDLGFSLRVPEGYGMFLFPRSSLSARGICCQHPPIDPGYTGNIRAIVTNYSNASYTIVEGERIGQLVMFPVVICEFVEHTNDSERGEGGFGSTGK